MPDLDIFLDGNLALGEHRTFSLAPDGGVSVHNRGFLGEERSLSITEARDKASRSSKAILEAITLLTNVLDCHEATIRKRWAKKSTRQRQDLLRKAWPDMAAAHAPDLAACKRRTKARGASGRDNGLDKNYALPYMNLEDLAHGNALLVLLNSLSVAAIELAHLIHTDKQQRQKITALSARFIADLGLACELHKQVRMLSPKYSARMGAKFTFDPEELEEVLKDSELMDVLKPLHDLKMIVSVTHSGDKYLNLGAEVDLSNGKLRYPINRSRTKENTEILQAAERHLDEIWDKYDAHLEKCLSTETIEKLQTGVPKKEALRRTPDWAEPEPKPAQQTTEDQESANVKFDGWTHEPFNKSKLEIRVKPKTPGSGVRVTTL